MSLYPPENCKWCEENKEKECNCACHTDANLAKFPHVFHLKQYTGNPDEGFKIAQINQLRKRFPELGEEGIQKMYSENLY